MNTFEHGVCVMDYKEKINELRGKTVLLPETFEKYGLNVEAVGFSEIEKNNFTILVEVVAKKASGLKEDIEIKANAYDEEGQIIASEHEIVFADDFDGINTYSIYMQETDILERVQKIRLYATR